MKTEVPFGKLIKDLTPFQESILTILYLSEKLANYPLESDRAFYASGKFFLYLNGIVFKSYHRKLMKQLEVFGWIRIISRSGTLYYALTEAGHYYKSGHKKLAQDHTVVKLA